MYALSRDPETIFTYWKIDSEALNGLRNQMGEAFDMAKPTLRLLDITGICYNGANAWQTVDIEIRDSVNNYYVTVPETGRTYMFEYGYADAGGTFTQLLRSNVCEAPRRGVSDQHNDAWSIIDSDKLIRASAEAMNGDIDASQSLDPFLEGIGLGSGSGGIA
jgi:hypothetical protein